MEIFINYFVFILILVFTHIFTLNTQTISGKQYFYGVYTQNIEMSKDIKNSIDKDFKNKLNLSLLFIILLYILCNIIFKINIGLNITINITIYFIMYFLLLRNEYKKVKIIKNDYLLNNPKESLKDKKVYITQDKELVREKKKLIKKFKVLFGICIGISLISFIYVLISYSSLPETIITHWDISGSPDGFTKKNIIDVFFTNFMDISLVLMLTAMGIGSINSNTYIDDENLDVNRKKAIKYLNGIGYTLFLLTLCMQSMTSLIPIFMVNQKNIPISLMIFGCIIPIILSVSLIYFYIMLGSLKPKDKSIHTIESDDEKWIYGFIYYNKDDSCVMVEKRFGAGWSINMAHPMGKTISIVTLIILIACIAICFI